MFLETKIPLRPAEGRGGAEMKNTEGESQRVAGVLPTLARSLVHYVVISVQTSCRETAAAARRNFCLIARLACTLRQQGLRLNSFKSRGGFENEAKSERRVAAGWDRACFKTLGHRG